MQQEVPRIAEEAYRAASLTPYWKILHIQGAAKKVIPCRIFQIFKQPLGIF